MIKKFLPSFLIFNFAFLILISAAFASLETGGYYENILFVYGKRTGGGNYGDLNRLRLRIDSDPSPYINITSSPSTI
jgi:hypothetical protein